MKNSNKNRKPEQSSKNPGKIRKIWVKFGKSGLSPENPGKIREI